MRPPRLSYANVVSTLALFGALGGGAYAASALPRHSVGAKQLKRGAVTSRKLETGAVTSRAVRNHALRRRDLAAGAFLAGSRGPAGPRGATGVAGITGPAGASAANTLLGNSTVALDTAASQSLAPSGPSTPQNATLPSANDQLSPAAIVVARDLNVEISSPPGGNSSRRFILAVNQTGTDVACTITGSERSCDSGGATATIPAGARLTLLANVSVVPVQNTATASFGWRATTP